MKKVILLLVFISGCISLCSAQQKFYIDITGISVSTIKTSPQIGDKAYITIHLQNDGAFPLVGTNYQPDSFPGGTYSFNYNAGTGTVSENKIDFVDPIKLPGIAWKGTATVEDSFVLSNAFFKKGVNNIIIIWPDGSKAIAGNDTLDTIPHATAQFYISDTTSGILPQLSQNSFKIYPNPAKDVINIQMNQAGTGIMNLTDMTGKLMMSQSYSAKAGENVAFPLNEGANIPDGIYLISVENGNSKSVDKILICR